MSAAQHRPEFRAARGLTILEVIATVVCLAAGLLIGMAFFGDDLRHVTSEEPEDPLAAEADLVLAEDDLSSEPTAEDLQAQIAKLQEEIASLREGAEPTTNGEPSTGEAGDNAQSDAAPTESDLPPLDAGDSETTPARSKYAREQIRRIVGERTRVYWNALNRIMEQEEEMRSLTGGSLTRSNAGGFIRRRGEAARFAADAIRKLPTKAVDREAVQLARDIADWYEQGAEINDQAEFLYHRGSVAQRKGSLGQSWAAAEKQHNAAVDALNRRGDALRDKLSRKYGLEFADLR